MSSPIPRRVAVAGASGFVGRALLPLLAPHGEVVALTRVPPSAAPGVGDRAITWRRCDLFSVRETEAALAGVDYAYYLVHSMMPSARLTQASFADLDLLLADNFARAAARAGVKQIIYLGGLVPQTEHLSAHLRSRLEVETALGSRSVPLTALRAGLVVGNDGASLQMLIRLVRRLPFMLCPRWTQNATQPIALPDVLSLLVGVLGREQALGRSFDVGGPDVMSYREMILRTAGLLGLSRRAIPVPLLTTGLSRLWVSAVTRTPRALVTPLIESLRHPMIAANLDLQRDLGLEARGFDAAVRDVLAEGERTEGHLVTLQRSALRRDRRRLRAVSNVRSVQRLPLPPGRDATWVAGEYLAWLPRFLRPILAVTSDDAGSCSFRLQPFGPVLLTLQRMDARSASDRQLFRIDGGALLAPHSGLVGRLEFREVLGGRCLLAAIHDYTPTLPWWVYNMSQARVHLWVMRRFARHLERLSAAARPSRSRISVRPSP